MEASRVGNREMVELLMEFGADPNTVNGVSFQSRQCYMMC